MQKIISRPTMALMAGAGMLALATSAHADDNTDVLAQLRPSDGTAPEQSVSSPQQAQVQPVQWQAPTWMRAPQKPMGLNAQGNPGTGTSEPCCKHDWGVSAMLGWDSEHIFRGAQEAKQNAVAEVEVTYGNYYVGAFGMLPTADDWDSYATRVDVYGGATFDISRSVYGDVGVTGYLYPESGALVHSESSVEGYAGFGVDNVFNPAFYMFMDPVRERYALEASAEYTLPVARTDLVLGGVAGYTAGKGEDYAYFQADAEIVQNINRHASVGIGGHFAYSTENTFLDGLTYSQDTTEWFGVRLRANKGK